MNHDKNLASIGSVKKYITGLLLMLMLVCATAVHATAPRVAAKLFGEEKNADIVAYQFASTDAKAKPLSELAMTLVVEAFKAVGKSPIIDVLPSKQLALYALTNNDAAVLMGSPQDLDVKEKKQFRTVVFYINAEAPVEVVVALMFGNKKAESKALFAAFNEGMQKLIKSGKYMMLINNNNSTKTEQAALLQRLKLHNPGWKKLTQ
jgi:hypothetical protein